MRNWIHTIVFNARARDLNYADFEQAICGLYAQGLGILPIAETLGMTDKTVLRHLKRLQVPRRSRGGWSKTRPQLIISYQGRDWTTSQLAREMGTYREMILRRLYTGRLPGATYRKEIVKT